MRKRLIEPKHLSSSVNIISQSTVHFTTISIQTIWYPQRISQHVYLLLNFLNVIVVFQGPDNGQPRMLALPWAVSLCATFAMVASSPLWPGRFYSSCISTSARKAICPSKMCPSRGSTAFSLVSPVVQQSFAEMAVKSLMDMLSSRTFLQSWVSGHSSYQSMYMFSFEICAFFIDLLEVRWSDPYFILDIKERLSSIIIVDNGFMLLTAKK